MTDAGVGSLLLGVVMFAGLGLLVIFAVMAFVLSFGGGLGD